MNPSQPHANGEVERARRKQGCESRWQAGHVHQKKSKPDVTARSKRGGWGSVGVTSVQARVKHTVTNGRHFAMPRERRHSGSPGW
jgi:hypothetical protein